MDVVGINEKLLLADEKRLAVPARRKFLVVEDDFAAQPIWEKIIKSVDTQAVIRWATSEEGAEKLINERQKKGDAFDFVIADIFLSGPKTGVDLWKKFGSSAMQFLFISSITHNKFLEMTGKAEEQCPMLIRKPFNLRECVDGVSHLLESRRYFGLWPLAVAHFRH